MSKKSSAARRSPGGGSPAPLTRRDQRAQQRSYRRQGKAAQSRPWGLISAVIGVVAVFVVVIIVIEISAAPPTQDTAVLAAPASVVHDVTTIPASSFDKVGAGIDAIPARPVPASPATAKFTSGGKPELLYVGAEYCPYCAAERWGLVAALSRFGTWSNLHIIRSSVSDTAGPNIATFTFAHGATYTSPYFVFDPREIQTNIEKNGTYTPFQTLTTKQADAFSTLANDGYPFLDFAGKYYIAGEDQSAPQNLLGLDWQQIASEVPNTASKQSKLVLGEANQATAAICLMTGQKPGSVCKSSTIQSLESQV